MANEGNPDQPELLSDPPDPLASEARVIEWYRLDASRRLVRALGPSAAVLTAGALVVSTGITFGTLTTGSAVVGTVGLLLIVAGPLAAILGLKRVLEAEDYLILRTDGIVHHVGGEQHAFYWDDLERVMHDEVTNAVVLCSRDDFRFPIAHRFAGISNRDLAKRLDEVRRKAIWGLLPEQR